MCCAFCSTGTGRGSTGDYLATIRPAAVSRSFEHVYVVLRGW